MHPDDRLAALQTVDLFVQGKLPTFEMEFRLQHKNYSYRTIHSRGALIRNELNKPDRLVGIHLDITDYKRANQLKRQQKLLDETSELLVASQTAIAIAHDLNQPLTAITHFADAAVEMLNTGNASSPMLKYALENCSQQAYRAGKVIPQLIAVLNKSEQINTNEQVDINELIHETLILVKNSNLNYKFNSVLNLESSLPPVKASRLQLQKVLHNLIQNSCDAMVDVGKEDGIITITTRRLTDRPNLLEVIVCDEEKGVNDNSQLKKMFLPFYTTKKNGLGIGLAICQDLVKVNDGDIWAVPNEGTGISVHITLPLLE